MGRGSRVLIARKSMPRSGWRGTARLCPVCGFQRTVKEFQTRSYGGKSTKRLNLFCNDCRRNNKEGVRRFLSSGRRPRTKVNRREVVRFARELARRRIQKRRGILMDAEQYAKWLAKLPDRIAAVVGKTYAVMGDVFEIADDQAVMMIRDLIEEGDETLIERNKNKRLARRARE